MCAAPCPETSLSIFNPRSAIIFFTCKAATQGLLRAFKFFLAAQCENRDFVPQVGLICALTALNPTETL
jgi:hypothetical protein